MMNKKELAAFDAAILRANTLAALRWTAWRSLWSDNATPLNSVTSTTEENALFDLAMKTNLQLWCEEEPL